MLRLPEEWSDRSVMIFVEPRRSQSELPASFVTTRDALDGQPLEEYAQKAIYDCAQQLEGFNLLERRSWTLANRGAYRVVFEWTSGDGPITQTVTYVEGAGDTVLCLTATALTARRDEVEPVFEEILKSVRLPAPE